MLEKISQSFLLKCGFQYNFCNLKKISNYNVLNKAVFTNTVWEYDSELDGEIPVEIKIFKSWGKWILVKKKKFLEINTTQDFFALNFQLTFNKEMRFLYIIESPYGFKIGRTKNIDKRGNVFNVKLPFDWHFYHVEGVKHSKKLEKFLHFMLKNQNLNGEWFELTSEDLQTVKNFIVKNAGYSTKINCPLKRELPTFK